MSNQIKKKNHCQTSVSEKFSILAIKLELIELPFSFLKEEHEETMMYESISKSQ